MIVLHHGWRSSASRRVRLCLEEKGLGYEAHHVDIANLEHHSPKFLTINPLGVIPTLIHDGRLLHESGTASECNPGRLSRGRNSIASSPRSDINRKQIRC